MGLKSHEIPASHEVVKGDPRIDGPYLDDYNAAYDAARRELNLAGQESQKERFESEGLTYAETEGTELSDGGTEERVLSETPTTVTTIQTKSKVESADDVENTDDGVDRPEGSGSDNV